MSTKAVQKSWGKTGTALRTSEGITKYNKIEYTMNGWIENFSDYLKPELYRIFDFARMYTQITAKFMIDLTRIIYQTTRRLISFFARFWFNAFNFALLLVVKPLAFVGEVLRDFSKSIDSTIRKYKKGKNNGISIVLLSVASFAFKALSLPFRIGDFALWVKKGTESAWIYLSKNNGLLRRFDQKIESYFPRMLNYVRQQINPYSLLNITRREIILLEKLISEHEAALKKSPGQPELTAKLQLANTWIDNTKALKHQISSLSTPKDALKENLKRIMDTHKSDCESFKKIYPELFSGAHGDKSTSPEKSIIASPDMNKNVADTKKALLKETNTDHTDADSTPTL
ncbi:MAG: hypothetical protein V4490_04585 [Pseudomonadota bacterium]